MPGNVSKESRLLLESKVSYMCIFQIKEAGISCGSTGWCGVIHERDPRNFSMCNCFRLTWHLCSLLYLLVARKLPWLTLAADRCVFCFHSSVRSSLCDLPSVEEVLFAFLTPWHAECFKNTPAPSFNAHHICGLGMFGLAVYPEGVANTSSV